MKFELWIENLFDEGIAGNNDIPHLKSFANHRTKKSAPKTQDDTSESLRRPSLLRAGSRRGSLETNARHWT